MLSALLAWSLMVPVVNASTTTQYSVYATTTNQAAINFATVIFEDTPLLDIARCESQLRQFNKDGSLLRGEINNDDIGFMQINTHYHQDEADKLNYDLATYEGNILFAKWLYDQKGTQPWNASKRCWSK